MYNEMDEVAPIIVGTIVNDKVQGFKRKLRMLRADMFAALSVVESADIVKNEGQSTAIKKGILALVNDCQDIKVKDCLPFFEGWEKILYDKCFNNEAMDVATINVPHEVVSAFKARKGPAKKCSTFAYATFLPPGRHQLLIYCPVNKKVYCKDVVIDLNKFDLYMNYPTQLKEKLEKKLIRLNVWKHWRDDSEEDMKLAFFQDIKQSF